MQKIQGIVYTPDYVIKSMFRSIDYILKIDLDKTQGMLSNKLTFYDPAVGSLSFEIGLLELFKNDLTINQDKIIDWYHNQFIQNFFGNELNIPAFFLGKILLRIKLKKMKIIENNDYPSINIKFQNALTPNFEKKLKNLKKKKKNKNKNSLIIFGNPPYSVSSSNKGSWIYNLMSEYKVKEPNITRLYDDYVKFLRLAQLLIEKHDEGIIAFITNRKFLDGKIYYGMRESLLKSFDIIYIFDLFGDSRNIKGKKGGENIFEIQTGIAISFFVKIKQKKKQRKI